MIGHRLNIIQKQSIEICFTDIEDSIGVQNRIAEVFYERLQPKMNALFNEIAGDKYLMQIDRLEIDCGTLSGKNWEDEWVENILRKLQDELRTKSRKDISDKLVHAETAADYFFYFISNGHLPWNCTLKSMAELENEIRINRKFIKKLKEVVHKNENLVERTVFGFSEKFRHTIINGLVADITGGKEIVYEVLEKNIECHSKPFQVALIRMLATYDQVNSETTAGELLERLVHLKDLIPDSNTKTEINYLKETLSKKTGKRKTIDKTPEEDLIDKVNEIYIENAGLVILHPFLPALFEITGLTIKNNWVNDAAQHHAVALLQFLVTGTDELEEFNLPLNKILCGMDTHDVYIAGEKINEFQKQECESLVTDVIEHWKVLKHTGLESFRETFIKRSGKLTHADEGWLLQVEQRGVDILLSSLPWGIGTIKHPWMRELIYSEWN